MGTTTLQSSLRMNGISRRQIWCSRGDARRLEAELLVCDASHGRSKNRTVRAVISTHRAKDLQALRISREGVRERFAALLAGFMIALLVAIIVIEHLLQSKSLHWLIAQCVGFIRVIG